MREIIESLNQEIQNEATTTRKVLDAVPEEKYDWRPHTRSMTAGILATHIATFPQGLFQAISAASFDISGIKEAPASLSNKNELLKTFDTGIQLVCQGLSKMSENQGMELWTIQNAENVIAQLPRVSAVKTLILNHMIHHRGQLSVYLRLLDVPVPSIYGPSADVNPFV